MRALWIPALFLGLLASGNAQVLARPVSPGLLEPAIESRFASKLLGSWDLVLPNGVKGVATFKPGGALLIVAPNPNVPSMLIEITGKYREAGSTLFTTFIDVHFKNTPAQAKPREEEMRNGLKKQIQVGTERSAVIKWSGPNAFTTTAAGTKVSTYKRRGH